MRKLLTCLILLLFITSCSKEEQDSGSSTIDLIGKWEETHSEEYIDNDVSSPYIEYAEPGQYIYEITEKYITVHTDDESMLFRGRALAYTYYPKDGEMTYLGFQVKVNFEGRNKLIFTTPNEEGKFVTYLKRLD